MFYVLVLISFLITTSVQLSLAAISSSKSVNEPYLGSNSCWSQVLHFCNSSKLAIQHDFVNTTVERFSTDSPVVLPEVENCYPWMFNNKTSMECECSYIPNRAVFCDSTCSKTTILDCYCMTFNTKQNEMELGRCLYGCGHQKDTLYNALPQKLSDLNSMCDKVNRTSTLCGKCKTGYSPLVYSYDLSCMNCTGMTYNWIKYIAVAYIPLTFFFFFVVIFRFSGTSPLVRSFITISQGIVSPVALRAYMTVAKKKLYLDISVKIFSTIYGIWNLDFFRLVIPPICLNISSLQALALDYAIAFYPLLLVLVTYILIRLHSRDVRIVVWLWKPFYKVFGFVKEEWNLEGSVVQAFATFFLLSYLKILNTTFDLLVYTEVYTLSVGEQRYQVKRALFYDSSVEYFSGEHICYSVIAILVGIFAVALPLVFQVVYPMRCFQKFLNHFGIRRQGINMLINCYQGYYKDGTNGSWDCRYFSVAFFLLQFIVLGLYTLSKSSFCFPLLGLLGVMYVFTILVVQPYKPQFKAYNVIDAFMALTLTLMFIMTTAADEADLKDSAFSTPSYIILGILLAVPLLYFVGLTVWWIFSKKKLCSRLSFFQLQAPSYSAVDTDDFPSQRENEESQETHPQVAPLLSVSQENYGSVVHS